MKIRTLTQLLVVAYIMLAGGVYAQSWNNLGTGITGAVNSLAQLNGDIYAAGSFTTAGGNPANRIAKWDGTAWSALGTGLDDQAFVVAVYNNELYVGGNFTNAGGAPGTAFFAKWDGAQWSSVGGGINGIVHSMIVYNGELYIGGGFSMANNQPVSNFIKWNGTSFSSVGSGASSTVKAMRIVNGHLYAAGNFTTIDGVPANRIAKYDGTSWSALGNGFNNWVYDIEEFNGQIYAGGMFTSSGTTQVKYLGVWNGTSWSQVSNLNSWVLGIETYYNYLYVGGIFYSPSPTQYLGRWDGTSWSAVGGGVDSGVECFLKYNGDLYVGGSFSNVGSVPMPGIGRWTMPPPPVAYFSTSASTVCAGGSVTFTDLSQNNPSTWNWSFPGGSPSSATTQSPAVTYANPGTYPVTLIVSNISGTDTHSVTSYITVNTLPVASAGSDVSICAGYNTGLSASGGVSYSWQPAAGLSNSTIANPVAAPSASIIYTVTVTGNNGCSASDAVAVTVNANPVAVTSGSTSICMGAGAQLSASGGSSYSWSPSAGLSNTAIANPVATPSVTTAYVVTITNAAGCVDSAALTVTVLPLPAANAGSDVAICTGSSTMLSASGGASYSWSPSAGLSNPSIANPSASPVSTTTYVVTVTGSNGCAATDGVVVTVSTPPAIPTITGSAGVLTSSASSGNQWYLNGNPIPGATAQTYTPTQNGSYTVVATGSNGCSSPASSPYNVTTVGVDESTASPFIFIYPNPSRGTFNVVTNAGHGVTIVVTDIAGRVVRSVQAGAGEQVSPLAVPSPGLYFVNVITNGRSRVQKIVVE